MRKKNLKQVSIRLFFRIGLFEIAHRLRPNRLTVLNYHRINDFSHPNFDQFIPNVSASVDHFDQQLKYMQKNFNIISIEQVNKWINNKQELPKFAALVTFDDGYQDNLSNAFPILQKRGIPACIFLASDYISSSKPFFWDLISYCFHHSTKQEIILPHLGKCKIENRYVAHNIANKYIKFLKSLPDNQKWEMVKKISNELEVEVPDTAFSNNHLTWDQVRYLSKNQISIGAHTKSHPILTRISQEDAFNELLLSKTKIEAELHRPVNNFAYPNGSILDFNPAIINLVKTAGFESAYSLINGSIHYSALHNKRFAINRIFVGNKDTIPNFVAKVCLN